MLHGNYRYFTDPAHVGLPPPVHHLVRSFRIMDTGIYTCTCTYSPLLGGCYVYNGTINLP